MLGGTGPVHQELCSSLYHAIEVLAPVYLVLLFYLRMDELYDLEHLCNSKMLWLVFDDKHSCSILNVICLSNFGIFTRCGLRSRPYLEWFFVWLCMFVNMAKSVDKPAKLRGTAPYYLDFGMRLFSTAALLSQSVNCENTNSAWLEV